MKKSIFTAALCAALTGCAETDTVERASFFERMMPTPIGGGAGASSRNQGRVTSGRITEAGEGTIFPGRVPLVRSSDFVNSSGEQTVSLTLVDVTIEEAAAAILGELLSENYIIDPGISGTVNIQSAQPISRNTAIEVFELALKQNGAALVRRDEVFAIVPLTADLAVGTSTGREINPGYALRVVPLRNIGAQEMAAILQPFASDGIVGIDAQRNLIVLAGTSGDQRAWQQTINSFDVDWMSNRSVGIFPIKGRSAQSIVNGLELIVETDESFEPLAVFEVVPENNSILVVAKTSRALESTAVWIKRLTKEGLNDAQIYSYDMKYARAGDVAPTLANILGIQVATAQSDVEAEAVMEAGLDSETGLNGTENETRVVASEATNTLLIHAPDDEYKRILGVLHRLDVPPRQVLVEATIIEVTLNNDLRYGVQYFFDTGDNDTIGLTRNVSGRSIAPETPGFSLTLNTGPEVVIDALEDTTSINVISSPNLMILNNESARLVVGDRVPVATQQATDASENDDIFVSTVEFQDTGVIFEVTPRINSSGAVTLDITQEVSNVLAQDADTLTPTISQRIIDSSISIDSGETIVMGGLFSATETRGNSGIPGLKNIPIAGKLFSTQRNGDARTELLVLITPQVINNTIDARRVTAQLRDRVKDMGSTAASLSTQIKVPQFGKRGVDTIPVQRSSTTKPADVSRAATPTTATASVTPAVASGTNYAILGSFSDHGKAKAHWADVAKQSPSVLAGMKPRYTKTSAGLFTVSVGPMDRQSATDVCIGLRIECYVAK